MIFCINIYPLRHECLDLTQESDPGKNTDSTKHLNGSVQFEWVNIFEILSNFVVWNSEKIDVPVEYDEVTNETHLTQSGCPYCSKWSICTREKE